MNIAENGTSVAAVDMSTERAETPQNGAGTLFLPASAYTSSSQFEAERTAIFERSWILVGDTGELKESGDYITATIGNSPVLIVRSHDGEIRGFLNVCRHRGVTLAEGRGHCQHQFKCPYHGWSYGTDGRLRGVPFREEFTAQLDNKNLIPIRIAVAAPLIFACLDESAPSFEHWAGSLLGALERARAGEMTEVCKLEYEIECNWKVAVENAMDTYHLPILHAAGEAAFIDVHTTEVHEEEYGSYAATKLPDALVQILPGREHLPEWDAVHVRMGSLFPNLVAVFFPGSLLCFRYDPISPERFRLVVKGYEYGDAQQALRDYRIQAVDATNKEDIPILERVQRGLKARDLPPFVYASRLEQRVYHFQSMVKRAMAGSKVRLTQLAD